MEGAKRIIATVHAITAWRVFLIANLQATMNTSSASPAQGTDFEKVRKGSSSLNAVFITTSREPRQQPVQCSFQKVTMLR